MKEKWVKILINNIKKGGEKIMKTNKVSITTTVLIITATLVMISLGLTNVTAGEPINVAPSTLIPAGYEGNLLNIDGSTPIPAAVAQALASSSGMEESIAIINAYIADLLKQEEEKVRAAFEEGNGQGGSKGELTETVDPIAYALAPNTQLIVTDTFYEHGVAVGMSTTIYGHFVDGNGNHIYTKTVQTYSVVNGDLKVSSVDSNMWAYNPDGSLDSYSHQHTDYGYNADGTASAEKTTGYADEVRFGDDGSKTVTHTDFTYEIVGGQAMVKSAHTTGTNYNPEGDIVSTVDSTSTYTYVYVEGSASWKVGTRSTSSTTTMTETSPTGEHLYSKQEVTIAYNYAANGGYLESANYVSGSSESYQLVEGQGYCKLYGTLDLGSSFIRVENGEVVQEHAVFSVTKITPDNPPPPPSSNPSDPAATGTIFRGADGQWYMNVKVWTNEEATKYETITIQLDLSGLSEQQRSEVEVILQNRAASGDLLTLFGLSPGGVLSNGTILQVLGVGRGPFDSHPYDLM